MTGPKFMCAHDEGIPDEDEDIEYCQNPAYFLCRDCGDYVCLDHKEGHTKLEEIVG